MAQAETWTHHQEQVNGIRLHWVEQGSGPLVVLLHGFPESWRAWRRQIGPLADAGFHVVAPDLRGYGQSERPVGVEAYATDRLTDDVAALIRHLGAEKASVAGHDWGGVVAWRLAMAAPELLERLVVINAPHPRTFARELRRGRQALKSWYAIAFQLPALPEALIRARDYAFLRKIFRSSPARPGAYSDDDVEAYVANASQPGALTAMLNYYRAARRFPAPRTRTITTPTLVIWGERDTALDIRNLEGLEEYVSDLHVVRLPEASHWVLADAPERAAELISAFFHGREAV